MDKSKVFKIGDEVKRINSNWSKVSIGDIFTIKKISMDCSTQMISVDENMYLMKAINFELVKSEKEKITSYHFRDKDIDFKKLCLDALEDNSVGFLVVGGNKAYVGFIQSGKSVGIPVVIEDFQKSQNILSFIPDLPYGIFEVTLDKVPAWIKKLEQYSKDYKKWSKDLNLYIKDRLRKKDIPEKDLKKYKVMQF